MPVKQNGNFHAAIKPEQVLRNPFAHGVQKPVFQNKKYSCKDTRNKRAMTKNTVMYPLLLHHIPPNNTKCHNNSAQHSPNVPKRFCKANLVKKYMQFDHAVSIIQVEACYILSIGLP